MNSLRIPVPVNHSASVEYELAALHERIALRAYERFLGPWSKQRLRSGGLVYGGSGSHDQTARRAACGKP